MSNGHVVTLVCALLGFEGSPIEVEIDLDEYVGDLREGIEAKIPEAIACAASDLNLCFATSGGGWLPWNGAAAQSLQKGEIHRDIQVLLNSEEPMWVTRTFRSMIKAKTLPKPTSRQIHVLVKVPEKVPPTAVLQLNRRRG